MITRRTSRCVLGCDIGSQSTNGILLSEAGVVVASTGAPHRVAFPAAGWVQHDVSDWLDAMSEVVGQLARAAPDPVTNIGISEAYRRFRHVFAALKHIYEAS